ncbi:hypothetical protein Lal_00028515, partial [Lupinus albus]
KNTYHPLFFISFHLSDPRFESPPFKSHSNEGTKLCKGLADNPICVEQCIYGLWSHVYWEFLKFIFVVNFLTSLCLFITAIALYYISRQEIYLYMPLSGFHGVISAFLWLPSIAILLCIAISFWTLEAAAYLPTVISGTYISWIYLRYWQTKPETKHRGDPSEDFAFSTFSPEILRPVIDPIASIFHRMLCGRFDASSDAEGYALGSQPLPGSDSIEASRRRERGARALEERLAAERLAAARSELQRDASENV